MPNSDREALDRVIREVTDEWPEPLDSVHDIPPLRNAILAAGFRQAPTEVTDEMVARAAAALRQRATWPSMHWPDVSGVNHRDVSTALVRAALEAALGGTDT